MKIPPNSINYLNVFCPLDSRKIIAEREKIPLAKLEA
jgi:hypothetical protein